MRRTPELLKLYAPRFSDELEALRLLDAETDECAALCDSEVERLPPKGYSHLKDEIVALGLKIRALKSGRALLTPPIAGLSKQPEMAKALNAVVEECATICDQEADSFDQSARSHDEDMNHDEAKLHFQIRDKIVALASKIRALKRLS